MSKYTPQNAWTSNHNSGIAVNSGPYIAEIMRNDDPMRSARLLVYIPDLGGDPALESSWTLVRYMSPFYGIQPMSTALKKGEGAATKFESYGMWMTPPDTGVKVLVTFVNGDRSRGVWMGCLPEIAAHGASPGQDQGDVDIYTGENYSLAATDIDSLARPPHSTAPTFESQGLKDDKARGPVTSGSMRESPSRVFGFNTPGSHSIVMDDGDAAGTNKIIRIRTATGNQIMMNDDSGFLYLINSAGTGWIELSPTGHIDVYGEAGINLATKGSINMHADQNINMHAGNSIKIVAADGVKIQGTNEAQIYGKKLFLEGVDSIEQHSCNEIKITSFGDTFLKGFGNFVLQGKCFRWNSGTAKEAEQVPPEVPKELTGYKTTVERAPSKEPWAGHDGAEGSADGSGITAQPGVGADTAVPKTPGTTGTPGTSTGNGAATTGTQYAVISAGLTDINNPGDVYTETKKLLTTARGKGYTPVYVALDRNNPVTKPAAEAGIRAATELGITIEYVEYKDNLVTPAAANLIKKKYPGATVVGDVNGVRLGGGEFAKQGSALNQIAALFNSSPKTAATTATPAPTLTGNVSTTPVPAGSTKNITPSKPGESQTIAESAASAAAAKAKPASAVPASSIRSKARPVEAPSSFSPATVANTGRNRSPANPDVPSTSTKPEDIAQSGRWSSRARGETKAPIEEPSANLGRDRGANSPTPASVQSGGGGGGADSGATAAAAAASSYPSVYQQGAMSSIPANPGGGATGDFAVGDNCVSPTAGGTVGGAGDPGSGGYGGGARPGAANVVPPEELKNDPAFQAKLTEMKAKYPGLTDDAIYRVISGESGFNTRATNPSGATGLFQFMPATAAGLGTSTAAIQNMSAAEQLGVYDKYLASANYSGGPLGIIQAAPNTYKNLVNKYGSYAAIPPETEIYERGSAAWNQNPPWRGSDGRITIGSINAYYGN